MIITTQDIGSFAQAIVTLLKDSQAVQDIGATVELAEPVNEDPSRCPWIGVYPLRTPFPPRSLGFGGGFRGQNNEFVVVCQQSDPLKGEDCLVALGLLVQAVTSALLSDTTIKGTVQTLGDFEVDFLGTLKLNDAILQTATVRAVGLTTVSGG
jgi:hypothetical protein